MPDNTRSAIARPMTNTVKLMLLRVELYTAMQQLTGQDLADFWTLIGELHQMSPDSQP